MPDLSHVMPATNTNHSIHANPKNNVLKIAIIGGGLTGLFTATLLERALKDKRQIDITVFEKSRSVGRLATRYQTDDKTQKNWQWAFGAQFFTAKTADFQQFIAPYLNSGLLQPWCANVITLTPASDVDAAPTMEQKDKWGIEQARYISTPKMTSWGRMLADELKQTTIKFKTRVAPLDKRSDAQLTALFDESGESLGLFDWVICTAPNGQAVDLMADSGFSEQNKICDIKMQACYTLMLGWENAASLPKSVGANQDAAWDVAYTDDEVLDRVFIEHQKPNRDSLPSLTIHARNDWSETNVDEDINIIKAKMFAAAKQALHWDDDTAPTQIDCHRWRYAATDMDKNKEPLGILVDMKNQWIVSGDWCYQGNIESCYQAAKHTAHAIIDSL